jgi:DNA-binding NtrC family response regulator
MMLTPGPVLGAADLRLTGPAASLSSRPPPPSHPPISEAEGDDGAESTSPSIDVSEDLPIKDARERWLAPMEREYLVRVLRRCQGDLDRAAAEAGLHRKSLERLLRQHGIRAAEIGKDG